MTEQPRILPLTPAHAAAAHALTQAVRWPHRPEDWATFIRWANTQGMACGLFHQQQLIGTALCWHWGPTHASLGLMIVAADWHRQGLGHRLLTHLLQAQTGRTLSLMATEAGLPLYRQLGFQPLGRNTQYQGIFQRMPAQPRASADMHIRPATPSDLDALCALDTRLRGLDRCWLLRALIADLDDAPRTASTTPPTAPSPASLAAQTCALLTDRDGSIRAYGIRRLFGRGWLIGPLVAPSSEDAIALLDWLCAPLGGAFVRVDLGWQPAAIPTGPGVSDTHAPIPADTRSPAPAAGPAPAQAPSSEPPLSPSMPGFGLRDWKRSISPWRCAVRPRGAPERPGHEPGSRSPPSRQPRPWWHWPHRPQAEGRGQGQGLGLGAWGLGLGAWGLGLGAWGLGLGAWGLGLGAWGLGLGAWSLERGAWSQG